jgi:superfamily II DNA or RNA helicase
MLKSRPWYRKCKNCNQYHRKDEEYDHDYLPVWDGKIKLLKRDRVPAGLFWATRKEIDDKENIKFEVIKRMDLPCIRNKKYWIKSEGKYYFQNTCVDKLEEQCQAGKGGLILNCTGSGKTRIASMLASRLDCDILFIVDQLVLLRQAQEEISKHLGEKVGYVGESKFRLERVTVGTIQTLHLHRNDEKFLKWFKRVDVLIIDEIHEMLNRSNFDVINIARPLSVIGLTATLGLSQKHTRIKAYSLCGPVIYEYPVQRGMQEGVLSRGICVSLQYKNSVDNIRGWDSKEIYEKKVIKNGERNHLICNLVRRAVKNNKYVIVYVERLLHLEEISERLRVRKVPHKIVAGTYKGKGIAVKDRFKSKDKFETGEIKCLLVNKVFKKGIDIKRVDLIINAAAKPNQNDTIQIFGRGVRLHKDKSGLICIDISDTDSRDKDRKKKNWLHTATKKRMRALRKAGIIIKKIEYNEDLSSSKILKQSEKWLQKEIKKDKP